MIVFWVFIPLLTMLLLIMLNRLQPVRLLDAKTTLGVDHLIIGITVIIVLVSFWQLYDQANWIIKDNVSSRTASYSMAYNLLTNPKLTEASIDQHKEMIRNDYPIDAETVAYIGNRSVDVLPWDTALCWAYGLNWSPRPVFQSYSAFTPELVAINGRHFTGSDGPQIVLYDFESIDYRYPLFDEPATFQALLTGYDCVNQTGRFLMLEKNSSKPATFQVGLGSQDGEMGRPIPVPASNQGYLFGKINIRHSLYGNVLMTLYKPEPVWLQFILSDGSLSQKHRLIPGTASEGLFLSSYVESTGDLLPVFDNEFHRRISSIIIETADPSQYETKINITFIEVPYNYAR
jgi:hypothetical protein